jgi:predicted DsbA family dithiol-disulfide isomerase
MTVDIWMDLTCPFCYLGKKKFVQALEQFSGKGKVRLRLRSFELDPEASKHYPGSVYDWLSRRYGRSREEVMEMNKPVLQQAESLGLTFNLDQAKPTNSFDAHRLLHFAATAHQELALSDLLFKAYFTEGKNISDLDILLEAARSCGLDESDAKAVLLSDKFADDVREDEALAQRLSIRGVPFFVFNGSQAVSGSQPTEVFFSVLERLSKA